MSVGSAGHGNVAEVNGYYGESFVKQEDRT